MPNTRSQTLQEKLLQSNKAKMATGNPATTSKSPSEPLPEPLIPLSKKSKEPTEVSLADLMALLKESDRTNKKSAEENRKNAEENRKSTEEIKACLNSKLSIVQQTVEENNSRVGGIEKQMLTVNTEIDEIRSAVKNLQNMSASSSSFQPNLNSTNITNPSFQISSILSAERIADVVHQFTGNKSDLHPEDYLYELEQFFSTASFSEIQKMSLFKRRLWSKARAWFDALSPRPQNYSELVRLFRGQFWSSSIQRQVRNELLSPFSYNSPRGLVDHAIKWVAKAQYLSPPIDKYDLVGIITQHFPAHIKTAIIGRNPPNTNELLTILSEMEESPPQSTNSFTSNGRPSYNSRPSYNNNQYGTNHNRFNSNYNSRGNTQYNPPQNRPVHSYARSDNRNSRDNRTRPNYSHRNHDGNNRNNNNQSFSPQHDPFRTAQGPLNGAPRVTEPHPRPIHQLNTTGNEEETAA